MNVWNDCQFDRQYKHMFITKIRLNMFGGSYGRIYFNCYKKWVKAQKGSISKRLSGLTKIVNVLVISLFVVLAAMLTTYFLSVFNVIDIIWFAISALPELAICIASYVYTSNYEINHSDDALNKYQHYCDELSAMLAENNIICRQFLNEIISRYKMIIDDSSKRIERNHERINKVIQILVLPVVLAVLSKLLDMQTDVQSAVAAGVALALGIIFLYIIIFCPVYMYNCLIIKNAKMIISSL